VLSSVRTNGRRLQFGRYAVLALAVSCLAGAGLTAVTAPRAAALSGRRLCEYNASLSNDIYRLVIDDYKKRGKCPYVNPSKHPDLINQKNPVPKQTCETVSSWVGYGDDICRVLKEDELYELDFNMKTLTYTQHDLGPVKNFG